MVEFALIVPVLLVLSMVMIQYGLLLNARLSLYNVARNTGRYAAVKVHLPDSNTDDNIKDYAVDTAARFGLTVKKSDVALYKYDPKNPTALDPSPPNTLTNSLNRKKYEDSLKLRIIYDSRQKLFLPPTFFGLPIFGNNLVVDNVFMVE